MFFLSSYCLTVWHSYTGWGKKLLGQRADCAIGSWAFFAVCVCPSLAITGLRGREIEAECLQEVKERKKDTVKEFSMAVTPRKI